MPLEVELLERAGSRSPHQFGFSMEEGRAVMLFRHDTTDEKSLREACLAIIGDVEARSDGALKRALPMEHPRLPGYYASRITNAEGINWIGERASTGLSTVNRPDAYGEYARHMIQVQFEPQPFAVISDEHITADSVEWVDEDGSTVTNKTSTEWKRFCDWEVVDASEILVAEQGVMRILAGNGQITQPAALPAPHGYEFPGKPRLPIPKDRLVCTWNWIPYRFWTSRKSALRKYKFRTNMRSFMGYEPGELLYMGARVKRFTPPFPDAADNDNAGTISQEKLCTAMLEFDVRQVKVQGAPTNAGNKVWGPMNCTPWFADRRWYGFGLVAPATPADPGAPNDTARWYPCYAGLGDFQILFADPDA